MLPNASTSETGTITCVNTTANVNGNTSTVNTIYSWSGPGGFVSANQNPSVSLAGSYTLTVTDTTNGCTNSLTINVPTDTVPPIANAGTDVSIASGESTTLTASGGTSYTWSPTNSLSCVNCASPTANPSVTTTYCVKTMGSNGCVGNDCVKVTVELECGEIFVPNAFSPNGDTHNDLECVYGNCIKSFEFIIYDRWGEKVFESSKSKPCWDGTFRGEHLNTAVFAYYLRAVTTDGKETIKKGNISLIR